MKARAFREDPRQGSFRARCFRGCDRFLVQNAGRFDLDWVGRANPLSVFDPLFE